MVGPPITLLLVITTYSTLFIQVTVIGLDLTSIHKRSPPYTQASNHTTTLRIPLIGPRADLLYITHSPPTTHYTQPHNYNYSNGYRYHFPRILCHAFSQPR